MKPIKLPTGQDSSKDQVTIRQLADKKPKRSIKMLVLGICGLALILGGLYLFYLLQPHDSPIRFIFNSGPGFEVTDDRVNVLLLGNAGGTHDGANLTDTVIVASLNIKTNKVYLISLPRDMWVEEMGAKINTVYDLGKKNNDSLMFGKKIIERIVGVPIHYAVRLDFSGFEKAIDEVGGIDVVVEKSFNDYLYPVTGKEHDLCGWEEKELEFNEEDAKKLNIEPGKRKVITMPADNPDLAVQGMKIATDSAEDKKGYIYFTCRYEHISYKKGEAHMDGETALKFVRSRMGTNGEGSDFARSNRQQKVIEAFRKKVLSLDTLVNPSKIGGLLDAFGKTVEVDIPITDAIQIYPYVEKIEKTSSIVLGNLDKESLFINPPSDNYGGAWVLAPRSGDYIEIQNYVKKVLQGELDEDESKQATTSARPRDN